jgi:hypothetical protein
VERVFGLADDEVIHQVRSHDKADTVAAEASKLSEGVGKVSLAYPAWADEDDVALLPNEVEGRRAYNELFVDVLGVVEVVGIDGGERKNGGAAQGRLGASFGGVAELLAHEVVEK